MLSRFGVVSLLLWSFVLHAAAQTTDGGRSDLPGMNKDIFDQINDRKKNPQGAKTQGRPECPKSDHFSPFQAFTIVDSKIYIKLNATEEKCVELLGVGKANISALFAAARTCGPVGEWKRRIAEELSAVFFVGGWEDWPKGENGMIDIKTETGIFPTAITADNYNIMKDCWARGCGCEQAKSPVMKGVGIALLIICVE